MGIKYVESWALTSSKECQVLFAHRPKHISWPGVQAYVDRANGFMNGVCEETIADYRERDLWKTSFKFSTILNLINPLGHGFRWKTSFCNSQDDTATVYSGHLFPVKFCSPKSTPPMHNFISPTEHKTSHFHTWKDLQVCLLLTIHESSTAGQMTENFAFRDVNLNSVHRDFS